MIEAIKTVGGAVGALITIITFTTMVAKPLRTKFVNWVKRTSNSIENDKILIEFKELFKQQIDQNKEIQDIMKLHGEVSLCLLRNEVTKIYYKYKAEKKLPTYVRENLVKIYDGYHALKGNSYITIIFEEMMDWEVI